jgi:hypothetical protein
MTILLISHIAIALSSIIVTTTLAVAPSQRKVYTSYGFIAATLATGTYLVVVTHTPLLHVCTSGLLYLGIALSGVVIGQRRLAQ